MALKRFCALIVAACLSLALVAGCSSGSQSKGSGNSAKSIGLVTDVGGVNDQSFNQSAWEGLKRLEKDTGANVQYIESKDDSEYAPNIDTFVDQGKSLIWGVGFMLGDYIQKAGTDYPDQQFAIIDYAYDAADVPNNNIVGVVFSAEECSFLVGYIAGKVTETGMVGHINGISSPVMESFAVGYYAGVLTANPNCNVKGQYSGSFGDPAAGKSIANQYYAEGCDIIYSAAGATGNGAIEAAKELGKWAIGVDMDQNYIAPENVLTSALKRVDNAMYDISKEAVEGTLQGGGTRLYNLKNNGVGYATTGNHIPKAVIDEVEAIKTQIMNGEIKVPSTAAELEAIFPGKYTMPAA